uniref:Uncharacterized protein n=1 Tax=Oryza sativa subsp. japonica TaxID=39947 RepID=Q6ZHL3_ORYSJ|nr:hypothetical protein [Oryza sativa Japonica Group]
MRNQQAAEPRRAPWVAAAPPQPRRRARGRLPFGNRHGQGGGRHASPRRFGGLHDHERPPHRVGPHRAAWNEAPPPRPQPRHGGHGLVAGEPRQPRRGVLEELELDGAGARGGAGRDPAQWIAGPRQQPRRGGDLHPVARGHALGGGHAAPSRAVRGEVVDVERGRQHGSQVAVASPPPPPPPLHTPVWLPKIGANTDGPFWLPVLEVTDSKRAYSPGAAVRGFLVPDRSGRRELYAQICGGGDKDLLVCVRRVGESVVGSGPRFVASRRAAGAVARLCCRCVVRQRPMVAGLCRCMFAQRSRVTRLDCRVFAQRLRTPRVAGLRRCRCSCMFAQRSRELLRTSRVAGLCRCVFAQRLWRVAWASALSRRPWWRESATRRRVARPSSSRSRTTSQPRGSRRQLNWEWCTSKWRPYGLRSSERLKNEERTEK